MAVRPHPRLRDHTKVARSNSISKFSNPIGWSPLKRVQKFPKLVMFNFAPLWVFLFNSWFCSPANDYHWKVRFLGKQPKPRTSLIIWRGVKFDTCNDIWHYERSFALLQCFDIDLLPRSYVWHDVNFQTLLIYHFLCGKPQVDWCMPKNHTCGRISPGRQKSNMSHFSCVTLSKACEDQLGK